MSASRRSHSTATRRVANDSRATYVQRHVPRSTCPVQRPLSAHGTAAVLYPQPREQHGTSQRSGLLSWCWSTSGQQPPCLQGIISCGRDGTTTLSGRKVARRASSLFGNSLPALRCAACVGIWCSRDAAGPGGLLGPPGASVPDRRHFCPRTRLVPQTRPRPGSAPKSRLHPCPRPDSLPSSWRRCPYLALPSAPRGQAGSRIACGAQGTRSSQASATAAPPPPPLPCWPGRGCFGVATVSWMELAWGRRRASERGGGGAFWRWCFVFFFLHARR